MGYLYRYGRAGVMVDKEKASYWFYRAAERGNSTAMVNLGQMYYRGETRVGTNDEEAVRWFGQASLRGVLQAKLNLAKCYCDGRGVVCDYGCAVRLASEVYETGDVASSKLLGELYYTGGPCLSADPIKAVGYFEEVLNRANKTTASGRDIVRDQREIDRVCNLTRLWLARAYIEGRGVARDLDRADKFIQETQKCQDASVVDLRKEVRKELEFARIPTKDPGT